MKILSLACTFLCVNVLLGGCTTTDTQTATNTIGLCSGGICTSAAQQYSGEQLLQSFEQLLQINADEKVPMCKAEPKTRTCVSTKVCHFVLGGILPGSGCANYLTFSEINKNAQNTQLNMKTKMPLTFIGTPVQCTTASSTLTLSSITDVQLHLQPHFCSWMVMGVMTAQLNFSVAWINVDTGEIGGYWKHSVKGTGNGSGSGYMMLKFPKNITWHAAPNILSVNL